MEVALVRVGHHLVGPERPARAALVEILSWDLRQMLAAAVAQIQPEATQHPRPVVPVAQAFPAVLAARQSVEAAAAVAAPTPVAQVAPLPTVVARGLSRAARLLAAAPILAAAVAA